MSDSSKILTGSHCNGLVHFVRYCVVVHDVSIRCMHAFRCLVNLTIEDNLFDPSHLMRTCSKLILLIRFQQHQRPDIVPCIAGCGNCAYTALALDLVVALAAEPQGVRQAFYDHARALNQRLKCDSSIQWTVQPSGTSAALGCQVLLVSPWVANVWLHPH